MSSGWLRTIVVAVAVTAASAPAWAQAINIDFGMLAGVPPDGYGAGAAQIGHWNVIIGNETGPFPVADVDGAPTPVTLTLSLPFGQGTWDGPFDLDPVNASLLNDALALHSSPCDVEIDGLMPGRYSIYTYAWNGDTPLIHTLVSVEGKDAQEIGGQWFGAPRQGFQYALHTTRVGKDGALHIRLRGVPQSGVLNGLQLVPLHP
jgi:hypothetical protein